ncbi:MAG TPA: DUF1549 domain-containing protein, partial [Planctomycetaceae bacterium]|nr:DUF1549 domain-containing protein [Planctomycetaceae bacterium]
MKSLTTACVALLSASHLFAADAPAPQIVKIWTIPEKLVLRDARDPRSLLVLGQDASGKTVDLSTTAERVAAGAQVTIEKDGYVTPVAVGSTEVVVKAAGKEVRVPVEVQNVAAMPVDYIRDFLPHLSKQGCNAGTCHGAQQGRKGFKLSLRGYDPLYDYRALVDDVSGRRFNRAQPSDSLMLQKPTQGVPHEGGFLFDEDSRPYRDIAQWITEGCKYTETARPNRLEVQPGAPMLERTGEVQQVQLIAWYPDGTSRDVTRDAIFETSNFEVATVSPAGVIKAVRRGEAAVLARYDGVYSNVTVTVLGNREGFAWKDSPELNFIDTHVNAKLQKMKNLPSDLCSDAEFLRRVSLDLTGLPSSVATTKAFLDDPRPSREKRLARIDDLLASPEYIDHWTLKWSDLLLSNRKFIKE